jgi:hypothetical protein
MSVVTSTDRSERVGRRVRLVATGVAVLLFAGGALRAQAITATAPTVTAAFLLKFVSFVDWPVDVLPPDAALTMCLADPPVATAVSRALAGRPATARSINVRQVRTGAVPPECGVLYVSDLDARRTAVLISALRGRSVLAVSDDEDFARRGGTIQLFLENGSMKFSVNPQAAERARLHVSSLLLKLAVIVKE